MFPYLDAYERRKMNIRINAYFTLAILLVGTTSACSSASTTKVHNLSVSASGANMPMGSGDMASGSMNGMADGSFALNVDDGNLCYSIMTKNLKKITEAHIQVTSSEKDVVLFDIAKLNMTTKSCMQVDSKVMSDMFAHPKNYSLMVHTKEYPEGAVMGSLK